MLDIARILVAFVGLYNFGGLIVDAILPATSKMHLFNPAWRPHAKFHNAQSMLMGVLLGSLTEVELFVLPLGRTSLLLAIATSGIYFWAMLIGQFAPGGVAWTDPEFEPEVNKVFGLAPQQFVSLMLTCVLAVAATLTFTASIG